MSDPTLDRLLPLVRSSLNRTAPDVSAFEGMTAQEWETLFELSARQGLLAITYETIEALPAAMQPPPPIKLRWALSSEAIENRYAKQRSAAESLSAFFRDHEITMLILKGLGISRYYPVPSHREFGDIDIYLCGEHDRGNRLIAGDGVKISYDNDKHSVFYWNGVMVENHSRLTDRESRPSRMMEEAMGRYIDGNVFEDGLCYPSPNLHFLFLLRHSARHLRGGLLLRYLTDWGLFLKTDEEGIDFPAMYRILEETGHMKFFNTITHLSGFVLGKDFGKYMTAAPDPAICARLMDDILAHGVKEKPPVGYLRRVRFKTKRLWKNKWKYDLLLPDSFYRDVIRESVSYHAKKPKTI